MAKRIERGIKRRETDPASTQFAKCSPQLEHTKRFTELHGEEKREDGDRDDQEEKRGNQKGRESKLASNHFLCALHSLDPSEMFMELHREEKREEGERGGQEEKRGNQKERDRSSQ